MRISDINIFGAARANVAQAREAAQNAQNLVSSGTSIEHPGDDPAGAGLMVAFQMSSTRLAAISKAASAASGELNTADSALGDIGTALTRARELAVQYSGTPSSNASAGAVEVSGLISRVIASLNTQFGNRYIFGGSADGSAPFQASGPSTGQYLGNADVRTVEAAPGVYQPASVRADVAMGAAGGGTNVIATLQALQTALNDNDPSAVNATLSALDASIGQVATARGEVGVDASTLDTAATAAKNASTDAQTQSAKQGEVDLAEASIQMQATQTALQATLSAAAQSFRISLLDYLS